MPRQVCTTQQVMVDPPKTGAGAAMGAIAGGALGNQVGRGDGRAVATIAGVIGGAMLGNRIEGPSAPQVRDQTTCGTQTVYENRLTGYNVVYEYAGKQYNVQLPQDPGPTIQLQVTPVVAPRSEAVTENMPTHLAAWPPATTIVNESRVVYVPTPVYRPYPPIHTHVNLGWGWSHGYGHSRRYGHWR